MVISHCGRSWKTHCGPLWSKVDLHCGRTCLYKNTLWSLTDLHCGRWCDFTLWSPTKYGYVFFAPKK